MASSILFRPTLSTILRDRPLAAAVTGAAFLQLVFGFFHLPGWVCPIFQVLHISCPGCGLTRASILFVRGDLKQALIMHAFAPMLLAALAIIAFTVIAPANQSAYLAAKTETLERHTGLINLFLIGLIVYWLARLVFMPA